MEDFPKPKSVYYIDLPGFAVLYPAYKPLLAGSARPANEKFYKTTS